MSCILGGTAATADIVGSDEVDPAAADNNTSCGRVVDRGDDDDDAACCILLALKTGCSDDIDA
eukprot:CAMPEP_0178577142 /NCGR_PEP_ID=MMETSP0697-20121206/20844_1 /TAXON_ID=265572 /ORGANISM="Extubocellulus spinifer, Strain CCMP396" /LENGTH=62 /DNA_ID=CAMNT_0020212409 /DNA_START=707 /DNA_END=895 /DNA_ORIENTATION=-